MKGLSVPRRMEIAFDGFYLLSAFVIGLLLITSHESVRKLWGIMAITLVVGDAFHLLPRIAAAYTGDGPRFLAAMGKGKQVTSITMTAFYLLLWHGGLRLFLLALPVQTTLVYLLVVLRVVLCLLPQNNWQQGGNSGAIVIYRNIPFLLQGLVTAWFYLSYASDAMVLRFLWLAILLSFAFYLPVVLGSSRYPKLGMLMLPKTCVYLWIICMGFWL